jgi:Domain of unknown function (DUF4388)
MSLGGAFATMPFPDLMQWLGDARRSGTLVVTLDFEERFLHLRDGALVALGSDDPRARDLSRLLLGRGLIDEARLRRALQAKEKTGRSLRTVLLDDGHVPAVALAAAVRSYAKDVALQIYLWHEGRFVFSDGRSLLPELDAERELIVDPPIPVRELVLDGVRRVDEWRRMAEVLPSDYTVVFALGAAPDLPTMEHLHGRGEPMALGDLYLSTGRPRFEIMEHLYEAWRRGLLAVDGVPEQIALGRHKTPTDVLWSSARTLIDEKQFDEGAALLRSVLDLDPYHMKARELLARARTEQLEELFRELAPYRIPRPRLGHDAPAVMTLSPRERYLYARLDGRRDVGTLTVMTPMGELETLRALKRFHHVGLIELT